MRRVIKHQRTMVGRLLRDIDRKAMPEQMAQLAETMHRARRLKEQETKSKNKPLAFHAPEVECIISKGRARQPYEFGVKASFAVTAQKGLIVGARSFPR